MQLLCRCYGNPAPIFNISFLEIRPPSEIPTLKNMMYIENTSSGTKKEQRCKEVGGRLSTLNSGPRTIYLEHSLL
jgi:hypothetical protein